MTQYFDIKCVLSSKRLLCYAIYNIGHMLLKETLKTSSLRKGVLALSLFLPYSIFLATLLLTSGRHHDGAYVCLLNKLGQQKYNKNLPLLMLNFLVLLLVGFLAEGRTMYDAISEDQTINPLYYSLSKFCN